DLLAGLGHGWLAGKQGAAPIRCGRTRKITSLRAGPACIATPRGAPDSGFVVGPAAYGRPGRVLVETPAQQELDRLAPARRVGEFGRAPAAFDLAPGQG